MADFPYDLTKLLGGKHRWLYAPTTVAVPDDITDIIDVVYPYAPKTGWLDGGATGGPFTYTRAVTKSGFNIQQSTPTVLEVVSDITRTFAVAQAEFTPEIMTIFEESTGIDTVAAGANKGSQKRIPFGNITSLTRYRVAVLAQRQKAQGLVTEPGGKVRGAWVGWVGYQVELAADSSEISLGEGDMATAPLSFTHYPETTITDEAEQHGFAVFEDAPQTISAT